MFPLTARRYFGRIGPRASSVAAFSGGPVATGAVPGSIAVLPVTATATYVNLKALFAQVSSQATSSAFSDQVNGVLGVRIALQAVLSAAGSVGVILGNAVADVTGANAPVIATQGTLTTGLYTPAAGTCWQMVGGTPTEYLEFEPAFSASGGYQDQYLGFVGSTTGSLLLFQCSNPSPL